MQDSTGAVMRGRLLRFGFTYCRLNIIALFYHRESLSGSWASENLLVPIRKWFIFH